MESETISVIKLDILTGITQDTLNASFESLNASLERMRRQFKKPLEELQQCLAAATERMRRDSLFTLLYYIYEDVVKRGDIQGLNQFVLKYWLHNHSFSYFEREQVSRQLTREDRLTISASAVLIWLGTFSPFGYYFSLPQSEREKWVVGILSGQCRRELLGEIPPVNPKKRVPLEEVDYRLSVYDTELEDDGLDLSRLGLDIDTVTKKEIALLYDGLNAANQGVEVGSKQGYSLRQYWGKDYAKNIKMLERLKTKRQKT